MLFVLLVNLQNFLSIFIQNICVIFFCHTKKTGFIHNDVRDCLFESDDRFHSHLENQQQIPQSQLPKQVSFATIYGSYDPHDKFGPYFTFVDVPHQFDAQYDPLRFKALHCYLLPSDQICRVNLSKTSSNVDDTNLKDL